MTAFRHPANSNEAHWTGVERVWTTIQQFPAKPYRSSWRLVAFGVAVALVAVALGVLK